MQPFSTLRLTLLRACCAVLVVGLSLGSRHAAAA